MSGLKFVLPLLLLSTIPAAAQHKICGSPPEFEKKTSETTKTLGDLEGKASSFARLLGSAELGGRVTSERQTIYKNNQPAEAARYDAYLAYVFCVTIMDDSRVDTPTKLKAIQEFRKPMSELTLPEKAHASLREKTQAAVTS